MGRGAETGINNQANANALLFGARSRGYRPLALTARRQLPLGPYFDVTNGNLLEMAALIKRGRADSLLRGMHTSTGESLTDLDVYVTSRLWLHRKHDMWRKVKMGLMVVDGQLQFAAAVIERDAAYRVRCHWFETSRNSGQLSVAAEAAVQSGPSVRRRSELWYRADAGLETTLAFATSTEFRRRWADIEHWPAAETA
jgi:hypothetical protein